MGWGIGTKTSGVARVSVAVGDCVGNPEGRVIIAVTASEG